MLQAIHGMREGFFNLSAFNLSATVSGFVKGQLDEAQAAIDDWRSDMRLARRRQAGSRKAEGQVHEPQELVAWQRQARAVSGIGAQAMQRVRRVRLRVT